MFCSPMTAPTEDDGWSAVILPADGGGGCGGKPRGELRLDLLLYSVIDLDFDPRLIFHIYFSNFMIPHVGRQIVNDGDP